MTDADLERIELRAKSISGSGDNPWFRYETDVPLLIAEVRRLRQMVQFHRQKTDNWISVAERALGYDYVSSHTVDECGDEAEERYERLAKASEREAELRACLKLALEYDLDPGGENWERCVAALEGGAK